MASSRKIQQWREPRALVTDAQAVKRLVGSKDSSKLLAAAQQSIAAAVHALRGKCSDDKTAKIVDFLVARFKQELQAVHESQLADFVAGLAERLSKIASDASSHRSVSPAEMPSLAQIPQAISQQAALHKAVDELQLDGPQDESAQLGSISAVPELEQQDTQSGAADAVSKAAQAVASCVSSVFLMSAALMMSSVRTLAKLSRPPKYVKGSPYSTRMHISAYGVNACYIGATSMHLGATASSLQRLWQVGVQAPYDSVLSPTLSSIHSLAKLLVKQRGASLGAFFKKLTGKFARRQMESYVKKLFGWMWNKVSKQFKPLMSALQKAWAHLTKLIKAMKIVSKYIFKVFMKVFKRIAKAAMAALKLAFKAATAAIKLVFTSGKAVLRSAWSMLKLGVKMAMHLAAQAGKFVIQHAAQAAKRMWDGAKRLFGIGKGGPKKPGKLSKLVGRMFKRLKKVVGMLKRVKGAIGKVFKGISKFFKLGGTLLKKLGALKRISGNFVKNLTKQASKFVGKMAAKLFNKLGGKFLKKMASKLAKKLAKKTIVKMLKKLGIWLVKKVGIKLLATLGASCVPGPGWILAIANLLMMVMDFFDLYKMIKDMLAENPDMLKDLKNIVVDWIKEKCGPIVKKMLDAGKKLFNAIFIEGPKKLLIAAGKLYAAAFGLYMHPVDSAKMKAHQIKAALDLRKKRDAALRIWQTLSASERMEVWQSKFAADSKKIEAMLAESEKLKLSLLKEMAKPNLVSNYSSKRAWELLKRDLQLVESCTMLGAELGLKSVNSKTLEAIRAKLKQAAESKLKLQQLQKQCIEISNQEIDMDELGGYVGKYAMFHEAFTQTVNGIAKRIKDGFQQMNGQLQAAVQLAS